MQKLKRLNVLLVFALLLWLMVPALGAEDRDSATAQSTPTDVRFYLLIGQSNMAGRAPFTEQHAGVVDRCYLLDAKDQWTPAKNPFNQYSTIRKGIKMQKMNPGYGFAMEMLEKDKNLHLGLVVNAKGGTRIEQWEKGTKFYDEAVRRAKAAQKIGTLKGILWHQGESNAGKPEEYLDKLKKLIEDLRKDLNAPDLPFVAGQVHDAPAINDQIAKLPQVVPMTGYVSSEGLKTQDRWHFDAPSMLTLGKRYAEAMMKLQSEQHAGATH